MTEKACVGCARPPDRQVGEKVSSTEQEKKEVQKMVMVGQKPRDLWHQDIIRATSSALTSLIISASGCFSVFSPVTSGSSE